MPRPNTKEEAADQMKRENGSAAEIEPLEWHELAGGGAIFVARVNHGPSPGLADQLVTIRYQVYTGDGTGGSGGSLNAEWVPS